MTSNESKIPVDLKALSTAAHSLNIASNNLSAVVRDLDDDLRRLNFGLTVWVPFLFREDGESPIIDHDEVGYAKVNGKWGVALRRVSGNEDQETFYVDGPWLFNDAPREMRLSCVGGVPKVLEALFAEAVNTAKEIEQKIKVVRDLTQAVKPDKSPTGERKYSGLDALKLLADLSKGNK